MLSQIKNLAAGVVLAVVLVGCGTSGTSSLSTPTTTQISTTTPIGIVESTPSAVDMTPLPTTEATPSFMDTVTPAMEATQMASPAIEGSSTPVKVVSDFLTFVQSDNASASSKYLSSRLRAEGKPMLLLLDIQNMYKSFGAQDSTLTANAGTAMVRATLNYESGPTVRMFLLIQENGNWVIDAVSVVP